ncbi:unnamed protein product [Caenorhabditis angaria]|uniref:CID domain-containing protein n=1 Tax=Caenorhabditis angaria TaxID=860376 RepID=A0A9P1IP02_9PELO|nr:unnamed protein product [Caenorhabditis angaria]
MSDFTEDNLKDRLKNLTNHENSITSLSKWLQQNYNNREIIMRTWLKTIRREGNPSKIVNLLYLANDVIQNSRKQYPKYKEDFFLNLEHAFRHASKLKEPSVNKALGKLIKVWKEREIYNHKQIRGLEDSINQKRLAETSFPTPAGQDPVRNPNIIRQYHPEEVKKNAQDVLKSLVLLQNPPSTEREIRVVLSQFPESISCPEKLQTVRSSQEAQELLKQNEKALPLLEDYCRKLKEETRERENLQSLIDSLIQNVRLSVDNHEKLTREVKRREERLEADLLEVERTFNSLPDLSAEMPPVDAKLPSLQKLFDL